jgi:hypothetical protein
LSCPFSSTTSFHLLPILLSLYIHTFLSFSIPYNHFSSKHHHLL